MEKLVIYAILGLNSNSGLLILACFFVVVVACLFVYHHVALEMKN